MSSPEIVQIVTDVYTNHLDLPSDWTPQRRREFLAGEAARISRQVAELSAEMGAQAVADWTSRRGEHPDYLTKVGLLNTAAAAAKETVLNDELYELISPLPDPEEPDATPPGPPLDRRQVPWDQRWTRTYYRSDPTPRLETLTAQVWPAPDFSEVFRIKAGYLLAARAEDRLTLPECPDDPLAAVLAQMVFRDLRHDGLPER